MKPLGQKPLVRNFEDCHCKKDRCINWWEDISNKENKAFDKREAKKLIMKELDDEQICRTG